MDAWMAFCSIFAIFGVVILGATIITLIVNVVLKNFDNSDKKIRERKDIMDYTTYKEMNQQKEVKQKTINFKDLSKDEQVEKFEENKDVVANVDEENDEGLEKIEELIKSKSLISNTEPKQEKVIENNLENATEDDFDIDDILSEISNEVIDEEKESATNDVKISDELNKYSIDNLNIDDDNIEEVKDDESIDLENLNLDEEVEESLIEDTENSETDDTDIIEEDQFETEKVDEESEDNTNTEEVSEDNNVELEEVADNKKEELDKANMTIADLKAQLEEMTKQLEDARKVERKVEVVSIDMTEEECLSRIETLEERLKNLRKDYKINLKEYKPLKKVRVDFEKYDTKLRRKEAVVAKKKVALYGVNNYVDIDKEKAEKLAEEIELLAGLRLSVQHCEEVINSSKDRFPILEHTNNILEQEIANLEMDLENTKLALQKIRDKQGNGENK